MKIQRHGQKERAGVTLQLFVGQDNDLIEAIGAIPETERQSTLKTLLRTALNMDIPAVSAVTPLPQSIDVSPLYDLIDEQRRELEQQRAWIQKIADDLPGYIQSLIDQQPIGTAPPAQTVEGVAQLDKDTANERKNRLRGANW